MAKSKVVTIEEAKKSIIDYYGQLDGFDTYDFCRYLLEIIMQNATPKRLEELHRDISFYVEEDKSNPIKVLKDTKATKILLTKR
jgi:hypothetical protein